MQDAVSKPPTPAPTQAAAPVQAPPAPAKPPRPPVLPGVIFDSDMGADIDAVLALALLYGSSAKVKLTAVTVSNSSLQAAAFCDALGRFYAGAPRNLAKSQYYSPVGLAENGRRLTDAPLLSRPLALKGEDGQPLFVRDVRTVEDTADVAITVRNALVAQKDGEAVIVMAGPASNMMRVLAMPGNREIVAAKVKLLVAAVGVYGPGPADPRVVADIPAARRLFAEWPTPIVAVGREVGSALPYPGASIAHDFAWSAEPHPVAEAYRAYRAMPYDAQTQALAAAAYAVEAAAPAQSVDALFSLSGPGTIEVGSDGRTRFASAPTGTRRYLIADAAHRDAIVKLYTERVSARPVVPAGRGPKA